MSRYRAAQEEARFEHGNDYYSGTIAHATLYPVRGVSFKTREEALQFLEKKDINKGEVYAVKYGSNQTYPQSAADKKLEEQLKALEKEAHLYEFSLLERFMKAKSSSKKCGHCESVISKKSRESLFQFAKQALSRTDSMMKSSDVADMKGELATCPACHRPLFETATDQAKKKSLDKRLSDYRQKSLDSKMKFKAKNAPWGYVLFGFVPY